VLGDKLIDVVVVAVINAVDDLWPSAPTCPLTIACPTLNKRRHLHSIGVQTIAEVEVFYLNLMPASCHALVQLAIPRFSA
jgi:hypothetical protein